MEVNCLQVLREIKSVSMASVDEQGNSQVRIIDVMIVENNKLYFCTARGKDFYHQLLQNNNIAMTAMTKDYMAIRLQGKVVHLEEQHYWIDRIFEENPVMKEVYPGDARYILEPFCVADATLEYFDLGTQPIQRGYQAIGSAVPKIKGFTITKECIRCGICAKLCPQQCIQEGKLQYDIQQKHCLHCGLCMENCPVHAILKRKDK